VRVRLVGRWLGAELSMHAAAFRTVLVTDCIHTEYRYQMVRTVSDLRAQSVHTTWYCWHFLASALVAPTLNEGLLLGLACIGTRKL
jgi:hypothetical protein